METEYTGKLEMWQLRQRQGLSLDMKERYTARRIIEWYEHYEGKVHVTFSGGKDSTVLLHQVRKIFPDVPAVFADTGLEYPEIRDFVKSTENVIILKPKIPFNLVIEQFGYPVVSKKVARYVSDLTNSTGNNAATQNLRLTGYNRNGCFCPSMKLAKKWIRLKDAPFKCSDMCCDIMKKEPFKRYEKEVGGSYPICGVMACDSMRREKTYLANGCNAFNSKSNPISTPMGFWLEEDVWAYIKKYNVPYSKIYDMGEKRTGCMFCMFGVHLETGENRFQRMKKTHPAQYDYCINKLGIGQVLEYIGVPF